MAGSTAAPTAKTVASVAVTGAPTAKAAASVAVTAAPAAKVVTSDVTIMAVVATVGTFLGAFQLFQPKLAIGLSMKREARHEEPGFTAFYVVPQLLAGLAVLIVWLTLLVAVFHQLFPDFVPAYAPVQKALDLLALQNLIPLLLLASVMAGIIQMNILSWIFLWIGWAVAMLPLGKIRGAFGADGRSAGWHQAWCICQTWDKGQPLLISNEEAERLGDELLLRLSSSTYQGKNFAPKPTNASVPATGNIALLGCIIEQAHSAYRWHGPTSWGDFYGALDEINHENKMFEPTALRKYSSGQLFSTTMRDALAAKMAAKGQPVPEANYFGVGSHIAKAWEILKSHDGSILESLPFIAGVIGSKVFWLDRRLSQYPLLHEDGMRQQVIKLMTRWGATPWAKDQDFLQPFSKTQAWLLLQEGVLTTLPEQKDVTFWGNGDIAITKVACRRVLNQVKRGACDALTDQAKAVVQRFGTGWDLIAAADYTLWNWAREQSKVDQAKEWKGSRWKLDNGRASKVG
jgi:hypothetical protein